MKSGRPITTGSKATKPIQFRVGSSQRDAGERLAKRQGISVNELAKRAYLEATKGQP